MRNLFTLLLVVIVTSSMFAQTPEKMSYQAVIRNNSDALVINTTVGIQISILQGSISGTAVYSEIHMPITNANGLLSLEIGTGTTSDDFSLIDWSKGLYFIKSETDLTGGTTYTITGISQLMSVPYALHAKTAESISGEISVTETDPTYTTSEAANITATDITNLGNLSGTNTGDQDISAIALNTQAIKDTAAQIRVDIPDVSGFVSTEMDPTYSASEAANITATDITNLGNLSGTNSGDQDISTIAVNTQAIKDTAAQIRADIPDVSGFVSTEADPAFTAWDKDYADLTNAPAWSDSLDLHSPDLSPYVQETSTSEWDKDASDDFDGNYNNLTNLPNASMIQGNDAIRFDIAGIEKMVLTSKSLEFNNSNKSVVIGEGAGNSLTGAGDSANTFVGYESGYSSLTSVDEMWGYEYGGQKNSFFGYRAGYSTLGGDCNVGIGADALKNNTTGSRNTVIGCEAAYNNTGGNNTVIGYKAAYNNTGGANTIIGYRAGNNTGLSSGSIFLGHLAGSYETGSNKLYIESSSSSSPLIYGEFDNDLLRINGTLDINNAYQFPTADGTDGQVLSTDGNKAVTWTTVDLHSHEGTGLQSFIGVKNNNIASAYNTTVSGGSDNSALGDYSTIYGGQGNIARGQYSSAAGLYSIAQSSGETVLGAYNDTAMMDFPNTRWDMSRLFVIGNGMDADNRSSALIITNDGNTTLNGELTINNGQPSNNKGYKLPTTRGINGQVLITDGAGSASWETNVSHSHASTGNFSFISGTNPYSPEGQGFVNEASGDYSAIVGGAGNSISGWGSVIVASYEGTVVGSNSFLAGGYMNQVTGHKAAVIGGGSNHAISDNSIVLGGIGNQASGKNSVAIGGESNLSKSFGEIVIGLCNTDYTPTSTTSYDEADRLFVVGNGTNSSNRSDALVMLKNGNTTLNGDLEVNGDVHQKGGFYRNVTTITSDLDLSTDDDGHDIIFVNSTSQVEIVLPNPTGLAGRVITVKCINNGTAYINREDGASYTINGNISAHLDPGQHNNLVCDGNNWWALSFQQPLE